MLRRIRNCPRYYYYYHRPQLQYGDTWRVLFHIGPSLNSSEGTTCDDGNEGSAANNRTCKWHETTTTTQQPMQVDIGVTARYHIPRVIIQIISRWRDIKVWIGVCRGYRVHCTGPICLRRPTYTTATRATRSLVFRLQQHHVHADLGHISSLSLP